jgi:phospholipase C
MVVIDHVVVLMLENRSFDHMLGFLKHPSPEFDGLRGGGRYENPGWEGGAAVAAAPHAKPVLPVGPDHSHDAVMEQIAVKGLGAGARPTNQGFVTSYERKCRGLAPATFGGLLSPVLNRMISRKTRATAPILGRGGLAMQCQPPEQVPVLSRLALEFAVCTRWFCSVPGETWPNRNFVHAATSDGETEIELRPYTNRTIFEQLEEHGRTWHVYHDDTPQLWAFPRLWDTADRHANWFPSTRFVDHVAAGELPAYSFIEPNHRPPLHTLDHEPVLGAPSLSTSQHPENNPVANASYDSYVDDGNTDFARAESLIAMVYEALRANPEIFQRSLLLITYDEHGGLYDHVPPPVGVPSPGGEPRTLTRLMRTIWHRKTSAFDFTLLGPRVPAVVVSPYIPAGTVDTRIRDHASVPATVRAIFAPDAAPLTARDAWAAPFHSVLTLDRPRGAGELADLSAHVGLAAAATAAAAAAVMTAPTSAAAAPLPTAPAEVVVPDYYGDFLKQAGQVQQHLAAVGEPEIAGTGGGPSMDQAAEVSAAFAVAAHRHRQRTETR